MGTFTAPVVVAGEAPFFGHGLGAGTNAGSALAGRGVGFALGEDDWQRIILESGPLVGNLFIFWRICLVIFLFSTAFKAARKGNFLPLFIFGACFQLVLYGQIGQPTVLGFATLGGGLLLAASQKSKKVENLQRAMVLKKYLAEIESKPQKEASLP